MLASSTRSARRLRAGRLAQLGRAVRKAEQLEHARPRPSSVGSGSSEPTYSGEPVARKSSVPNVVRLRDDERHGHAVQREPDRTPPVCVRAPSRSSGARRNGRSTPSASSEARRPRARVASSQKRRAAPATSPPSADAIAAESARLRLTVSARGARPLALERRRGSSTRSRRRLPWHPAGGRRRSQPRARRPT